MQLIQILTIILMIGMTYVIYQTLGARRKNLLYTAEEKKQWDSFIGGRAGGWLTIANVVGTLTSLAGAYVFFIGSSKLFGFWILICSVSIFAGAKIANIFTNRILNSPRIRALVESPDQTGGVIASIFWAPDPKSRRTAQLVKWVSILNLVAILWLEFSVFASIGSHLLALHSTLWISLFLLICCFTIVFFTLRYGLRGFVFADLFQSPMILLAGLAILGGCIALWFLGKVSLPPVPKLVAPLLSNLDCVLFVFHNICLNGLLLLVTEAHWLRIWIFREREIKYLPQSSLATGFVWAILIILGFMAYYASDQAIGVKAVAGLLGKLNELSIVFSAVFWIGGIAALFSTADETLYSLLVVSAFNSKTGMLDNRIMANIRPYLTSILVAACFAGGYALIEVFQLPVEKLLFIVFPLSLNVFPAFVRAFRGLPQRPWYILFSLLLYFICAILGLMQPESNFAWTLAAALAPVVVGIMAAFGKKYEVEAKPASEEALQ